MSWKIIDSGAEDPRCLMQRDADLLNALRPESSPILHLYDFDRPSATYGYFTDPTKYLKQNAPITLARRPTGGGIIFHTSDFAFSVLLPSGHEGYSCNTLDNYAYINRLVAKAIFSFTEGTVEATLLQAGTKEKRSIKDQFCFAKPTVYDLIAEGKKVAGAAQRRKKQGLLHQGSISLTPPSENLLAACFHPDSPIPNEMILNSYYLIKKTNLKKEQIKEYLIREINNN